MDTQIRNLIRNIITRVFLFFGNENNQNGKDRDCVCVSERECLL